MMASCRRAKKQARCLESCSLLCISVIKYVYPGLRFRAAGCISVDAAAGLKVCITGVWPGSGSVTLKVYKQRLPSLPRNFSRTRHFRVNDIPVRYLL